MYASHCFLNKVYKQTNKQTKILLNSYHANKNLKVRFVYKNNQKVISIQIKSNATLIHSHNNFKEKMSAFIRVSMSESQRTINCVKQTLKHKNLHTHTHTHTNKKACQTINLLHCILKVTLSPVSLCSAKNFAPSFIIFCMKHCLKFPCTLQVTLSPVSLYSTRDFTTVSLFSASNFVSSFIVFCS